MIKKIFILNLPILISLLTVAHEFWLQPHQFLYRPGDTLKIDFNIGENFIANQRNAKLPGIEKLELHQLGTVTDIKPFVKEGDKGNLLYPLVKEGTHVVILQSKNAYIELDAGKFNAYLKEDGLEDALHYRKQNGLMNKIGSENYVCCSKLIFQVGMAKDGTYKKSFGMPLEIFMEKNPMSISVGDPVKFRVMFKGKPLFGAKVTVWNRYDNRTTIQPAYTLKDGTIEARISNKGPWMVSVVKMAPSEDKSADWQSYWGSLVFGIRD